MSAIDINIVKEQYQRMHDEELIRFARNESQSLTIQSFHALKAEFEARGLDLSVIEDAKVTRELQEATKISEFEQTTANEFTETIWKFAFDEKEAGKTDEEVFNALIKKNIKPDYAYMLIENIGPKSKELAENFDTEIIVGWALLIVGVLAGMILYNLGSKSVFLILWVPVLIVGGIVRIVTSQTKKKKFQTIASNIEAEREVRDNLFQ